ncbi:hypothetical protein H6P81_007819 [Aristolochia fimbriata]|uniref:Uncharacterized protein n=1 Tax=Aristolochia fimbriata TaxID=158543 RepID=A0AAV7F3L8_ARIFI|nr:hypothetical protein H6P81_007819 [Aristolochia fimbriata]
MKAFQVLHGMVRKFCLNDGAATARFGIKMLPSSVTRACDPSGGVKVVWMVVRVAKVWAELYSETRPFQAVQSNPVAPAKAGLTLFLDRWAPREAGFTEQRQPPPVGSGRITSWLDSVQTRLANPGHT